MAKDLQLVVFSTGKELYGVAIQAVHEIVKVPEITEVPDAPVFLEGVINLRGKIVPVIDLRKRLRLGTGERSKSTRILIIENSGKRIGLLVDAVSEVIKVPPEAVEAPPEMIASVGVEYITGVVKSGSRLIVLIDLGRVLNVEDMKRVGTTAERIAEASAA
ncbi:MAG: chemotaxis protein CheW [Nitrospirota bacterium]|nr:chemotaxis protein CheW [Nitrospirota bacterium]